MIGSGVTSSSKNPERFGRQAQRHHHISRLVGSASVAIQSWLINVFDAVLELPTQLLGPNRTSVGCRYLEKVAYTTEC